MSSVKQVSSSVSPEEFLSRALQADTAGERMRWAQRGLEAETLESDTEFLLLRQVYLSEIESHRFHAAAEIAATMAQLGSTLEDLAHHDRSRALQAVGETVEAIAAQRMAARTAPPARRSFQGWGLATLLHFVGDHAGAASALRRAERWAHDDRPLLRAHRAWILLESGDAVDDLEVILADLESSSVARKGYGEFVLGMLRYQLGDHQRAAVHLRVFLRRNAAIDSAKATTLREELRLARMAMAEIESD